MLGAVLAVFRPLASLITGIFGGVVTNYFVKNSIENKNLISCTVEQPKKSISSSFKYAFVGFLDDISGKLLFGILIAGLISYFMPNNFFQDKIGNDFLIIMILAGIPMYICATGSIPIAVSLMAKGVSAGSAFVFLMVGPAMNIATIYIIGKSLGKKIVAIYLFVIIFFALIFGSLLNLIYKEMGINAISRIKQSSFKKSFFMVLTIIFSIFIILSIYRKIKAKIFNSKENEKMGKKR